jgi:phage-related protein
VHKRSKEQIAARLDGGIRPHFHYDLNEVEMVTNQSRSEIYEDIKEGIYEAVKDGRRTRITGASILRRNANLPRMA